MAVLNKMKRMGKGLAIAFCLLLFGSTTLAITLPQSTGTLSEIIGLYDLLNRKLRDEAALELQVINTYRLISQPHSEYLLYQNGLGLQSRRLELERVRFEKAEILRRLSEIGGDKAFETSAYAGGERNRVGLPVYSSYSGAPMLSFSEGRFTYAPRLLKSEGETQGRYRFLMGIFLLTALSLPGLAFYKGRRDSRILRNTVALYPIFRVYGNEGDRNVLRPFFRRLVFDPPRVWMTNTR